MTYTKEDFEKDLVNKEMPHTKSRERFESFYNELGKLAVQRNQSYQKHRMDFLKAKGEVLELGCHTGFNLIHYAQQGLKCTGVDISQPLLDVAQERINFLPKEVQERITLIRSWIEDLVVDKQYDTILLTELLEHVIDPFAVLKKAKEFLKPNGIIYITSPSTHWGNNSHIRGVSREYLEALLDEAGLQATEWHFVNAETVATVTHKKQ